MLAPATRLPSGAIPEWAPRDLWHRIGMELGVIPPPAGTERIERQFSLSLRASSMNAVPLKSRSFDRLKVDLQGRLMREMHALRYLLSRPIPSVGEDSRKAPVYTHVRLRFDKAANRDDENFRVLVAKALGDALVGPKWTGRPGTAERRPANRVLIYKGAAYEGGWLSDDTARDWNLTLDIDRKLGPAGMTVRMVWDQPIGG